MDNSLLAVRDINHKYIVVGEILIDMDDLIFYEVAVEMQMKNAFLVTGNLKHYPSEHFIITPAQMIELLNTSEEVG